jgi:hypothetical protein
MMAEGGMMKAALLLAPAAVATFLAACDQSPPTQPRQPIVVRSEAQDQLHQLDDLNRAIGLKRAIYQSGYTCKRVESSGYVQEHENLSMWMAKCDDKRDWAIFVGPDGTAQVRPCRDLAELGLPACVMKKSPARPRGQSG